MSDQSEPVGDDDARDLAVPAVESEAGAAEAPTPADPVRRELTAIDEAMTRARSGVPHQDGEPRVPADDEVAGLEQAHEALRATLDRVERGS